MEATKKNFKKITAILAAIAMVAGLLSTVPQNMATVQAADSSSSHTPSVTAYAAKEQLMDSTFAPKSAGIPENVGKLYFGKNSKGNPQEWYILGGNRDVVGENTAIFAANPITTLKFVSNGSGSKSYQEKFGKYYGTNPPARVYGNHWGGSSVRSELQSVAKSTDYFSAAEQAMMNATEVSTWDRLSSRSYNTTDKLYLAEGTSGAAEIVVGGLYQKVLALSTYGESTDKFWLRSPKKGTAGHSGYEYSDSVYIVDGQVVSDAKISDGPYNVQPASNLNLSKVIFASAAMAPSSDTVVSGTISRNTPMTLRLNGDDKDIGTVTYNVTSGVIKATKGAATGDVALVVQGNDGTNDWYYSSRVTGRKTVSLSSIEDALKLSSEISASDCKIWLETTEDNVTYAVNATEEVFKEPTVYSMNIGSTPLYANPDTGWSEDDQRSKFVFFGGMSYRILRESPSTQEVAEGCILLDQAEIAKKDVPFSEIQGWKESSVEKWLNGDKFYNSSTFTDLERNAIQTTKLKGTGSYEVNGISYEDCEAEDKIFLLSAKEADALYKDDAARKRSFNSDHWLRSGINEETAGVIRYDGKISCWDSSSSHEPVISPAFNLDLSSVLFTTHFRQGKSSPLTVDSENISQEARTDNFVWVLTLKDDRKNITIQNGTMSKQGEITVPYSYTDTSTTEKERTNQISVMITDKPYSYENENGAKILYYGALQNIKNVSGNGSTVGETENGTGTFVLPSTLNISQLGTDYHIYLLAEHANEAVDAYGGKQYTKTDYASMPVELNAINQETFQAPTVYSMNIGSTPLYANTQTGWKAEDGVTVYIGGSWYPFPARVLGASPYTQTVASGSLLLESDKARDDAETETTNKWSGSRLRYWLNHPYYDNYNTVFTSTDRAMILDTQLKDQAAYRVADSESGLYFQDYASKDKIFILSAKETEQLYADKASRVKTGQTQWRLRSAAGTGADTIENGTAVGVTDSNGNYGKSELSGTSAFYPAFNIDLSAILFTSVIPTNEQGKFSPVTADSVNISETPYTGDKIWKLTLKDSRKTVQKTQFKSVEEEMDGSIVVPYTYTDTASFSDEDNVNQISIMITDKAYSESNANNAKILYYGALQNIKNSSGEDSAVANAEQGTGTFVLPNALKGQKLGEDYHIYLLAERVNGEDQNSFSKGRTDYASEPVEITYIRNVTWIDNVDITGVDTPVPGKTLDTEAVCKTAGVNERTPVITWTVDGESVTEAEYDKTYTVSITLTAYDRRDIGYLYGFSKDLSVQIDGDKDVTVIENTGTTLIITKTYTIGKRKITKVTEPSTPENLVFANYYTAGDVLTDGKNAELGEKAKVTLEGEQEPTSLDMDVTWTLENSDNAPYDTTLEAENTFRWTISADQLENYDPTECEGYDSTTGKVTSGTITGTVVVKNKAAMPVTITGTDASIHFDQTPIDVAQYFTMDENAGAATYSLVAADEDPEVTGEGTLSDSTLTVTKTGVFKVRVTTAAHGYYGAGEKVIVLTVKGAAIAHTVAGYSGTYDGQKHGITVAVTKPEGVTVTYSADGTDYTAQMPEFTDAGTYTVFYKLEKENYETVSSSEQVIISEKNVTITAQEQTVVKNGSIDQSKYAVEGLLEGNRITEITLDANTGEFTENGTITATGVTIVDAFDQDVTDNYNIICKPGQLKVIHDVSLAPDSITAEKIKKTYTVGDSLILDDLTVMAYYTDGYSRQVTDFTTNVAEIDMSIAGDKTLLVSYTENEVTREYSITITVSPEPVKTYVLKVVNGTGTGEYEAGALITVKADPAPAGQRFASWSGLDGLSVSSGDADPSQVTFYMPANNLTVTALYEEIPVTKYTITVSSGDGGSVTPGTCDVAEGTSQTFEMTPNEGYEVDSVKVDGEDVEETASYTFSNVTGPHTLEVTFRLKEIPPVVEAPVITTQPGGANIKAGETATFTITATGTSLAYQWQIDRNDGNGFVNIPNANQPSYTTSVVDKSCDGFKYQCIVSNAAGLVTSSIAVLTVTEAVVPTPVDYRIIDGANGNWVLNTDGSLVIRGNGDFSKFTGVKVDGVLIDARNYTVTEGSTIVTLKADYLNTLSQGSHTFEIVWNDGSVATNFTVSTKAAEDKPTPGNSNNGNTNKGASEDKKQPAPSKTEDKVTVTAPKTGDDNNATLWAAIMTAILAGLAVLFECKKKDHEEK